MARIYGITDEKGWEEHVKQKLIEEHGENSKIQAVLDGLKIQIENKKRAKAAAKILNKK